MPEVAKVRYTHDAMIDMIVANPSVAQNDLAAAFGFTPSWISVVINSDAFKERLAERKSELVDPLIRASISDRLNALASKSAEVLLDKLHAAPDAKVALKALEITTKALGYGAKVDTQVNLTQYVAVVPQRSNNSQDWAQTYGRDSSLIAGSGARSTGEAESRGVTDVVFDSGACGDAIGG